MCSNSSDSSPCHIPRISPSSGGPKAVQGSEFGSAQKALTFGSVFMPGSPYAPVLAQAILSMTLLSCLA
jgi:hypothetical protein